MLRGTRGARQHQRHRSSSAGGDARDMRASTQEIVRSQEGLRAELSQQMAMVTRMSSEAAVNARTHAEAKALLERSHLPRLCCGMRVANAAKCVCLLHTHSEAKAPRTHARTHTHTHTHIHTHTQTHTHAHTRYHQSILSVSNAGTQPPLPSAPHFPPVELAFDANHQAFRAKKAVAGKALLLSRPAPIAAERDAGGVGGAGDSDVAEFPSMLDGGPSIIRSQTRLVYPSEGGAYRGGLPDSGAADPGQALQQGDVSEIARFGGMGDGQLNQDLDALMERNRAKLGRLRRALAEGSGRREADLLVGKFVADSPDKARLGDQALLSFSNGP